MMSKKDYVAIARCISDGAWIECQTQSDVEMNRATRAKIARQLAEVMVRDNPRFNRLTFIAACGVQS